MDSHPLTRRSVLVWDAPLRLFHWLLAACFAVAYALGESDALPTAHALFGYTVAALLAFRLLWAIVGTRHARFASWPLAPAAALRYLRSVVHRRPEHHVGHNPAGSWAALVLLGLLAVTVASGVATYLEVGPEWLEDVHEALANATLLMVLVHIAAVLMSSVLHRENLVRAMITGRKELADTAATEKPGTPAMGSAAPGPAATEPAAIAAAGPRTAVALVLLAGIALLWSGLVPLPGVPDGTSIVTALDRGATRDALERSGPRAQTRADLVERDRNARRERRRRDDD